MFTSYFHSPLLTPGDPRLVSIARWAPFRPAEKAYRGRGYPALAPPKTLQDLSKEEYTKAYRKKVLDRLDPRKVFEDLGEDSVLLCWERPGQFCHRRLVAEWLEFYLGIKVPELVLPLLVLGSQGNLCDAP